MRKYELMYIVRPNIEEEAKKALVERFNEILTSNGGNIGAINGAITGSLKYAAGSTAKFFGWTD